MRGNLRILLSTMAMLAVLPQALLSAETSSGSAPIASPHPIKRESKMKSQQLGSLLIIGGSAKSTLKDLVKHAGGKRAHIVLVPHASSVAAESSDETTKELLALGAGKVTTLMPGRGKRKSRFAIPEDATAVYILGGDQLRLVKRLGESGAEEVRRFYNAGGLVAGTSAGAAAIAPTMIAGGMSKGKIDGTLKLAPGLNLLDHVLVDTHFGERGRFNRLMVGVTRYPQVLGIGLDEDTGVLIRNGSAVVVGKGHVTLFRASADSFERSSTRTRQGAAASVIVTTLSRGDRFDLAGDVTHN